jgi:hypothetical protein
MWLKISAWKKTCQSISLKFGCPFMSRKYLKNSPRMKKSWIGHWLARRLSYNDLILKIITSPTFTSVWFTISLLYSCFERFINLAGTAPGTPETSHTTP